MRVKLKKERGQPLRPVPPIDGRAVLGVDKRFGSISQPDLKGVDIGPRKLHEPHAFSSPPPLDRRQDGGSSRNLSTPDWIAQCRIYSSIVRVAQQEQASARRHHDDDDGKRETEPTV